MLLSLFVFSFVLVVYWVFSILPIVTNIISNRSTTTTTRSFIISYTQIDISIKKKKITTGHKDKSEGQQRQL